MDHAAFYAAVRLRPFGGSLSQMAVDGLNALVSSFGQYGDGDKHKLAYILATGFHEADRFKTMEEYASGAAYEGRQSLGNTEAGDGKRFKGRGFVQITGRRNYTDWSRRLGLDLVGNPDLAEQRPIAARICVEGMMLGTFTGRRLSQYIANGSADYKEARRVVNGADKADVIASYALAFQKALEAAKYGVEEIETEPEVCAPPMAVMHVPEPQAADPIAAISKAVGAAKGGALGGLISTGGMTSVGGLLSAANWLPSLSTTQLLVVFGGLTMLAAVVLAAGFAFWRAYKAPPNQA